MERIYTLTVEDKAGVLDRISGFIRRNGWNMKSVSAVPITATEKSTVTLCIDCGEIGAQKIGKQLESLDCVFKVVQHKADEACVKLELMLIKTPIMDADKRWNKLEAVVVSSGLTVYKCVASKQELDDILAEISREGSLECTRSGVIALTL